ncbi:MAG: hypothetical protein AAF550_05890 [Myxococcota bacterium]
MKRIQKSHGVQPKEHGVQPKEHGVQPKELSALPASATAFQLVRCIERRGCKPMVCGFVRFECRGEPQASSQLKMCGDSALKPQ